MTPSEMILKRWATRSNICMPGRKNAGCSCNWFLIRKNCSITKTSSVARMGGLSTAGSTFVSFVVKTAQAYRPHVLDNFEPDGSSVDFKRRDALRRELSQHGL